MKVSTALFITIPLSWLVGFFNLMNYDVLFSTLQMHYFIILIIYKPSGLAV